MNNLQTTVASVSLPDNKRRVLLDALRGGVDIRTAAHYAEISYTLVFRVMEQGQRLAESEQELTTDELALVEFWREARKARADAVVRNVAQIQKAANQGEWKAAAWWLERSLPDVFNATDK